MNQTEQNYQISEGALQRILTYLGTRPYVEVFELVKSIQSATPLVAGQQVTEETSATNSETEGTKASA